MRPVVCTLLLAGLAYDLAAQRAYPFPTFELNSCPLECCHFGNWTVLQPITVYAREADRKSHTVRLGAKAHVVADSGARHIEKPGILIIDVPTLDARRYVGQTLDEKAVDPSLLMLNRGDTVYVTADLADPGGWVTWFHGHSFWPHEGSGGLNWTDPAPGTARAPVREAQKLVDVWWVHVRYGCGASGWIDATHAPSISGMGECSGGYH